MAGPVERFETLSERAQVLRLRHAAMTAIAHYPIEVRSVRLLFHGYNTTFRVDAYLDTGTYRHDVPGVQPIDL